MAKRKAARPATPAPDLAPMAGWKPNPAADLVRDLGERLRRLDALLRASLHETEAIGPAANDIDPLLDMACEEVAAARETCGEAEVAAIRIAREVA